MASNGGPPIIENLASLLGVADVTITATQPQMARDKQNHVRALTALIIGGVLSIGIAGFLIWIYPTANPETQGKIITALTSLAAAAVGVVVGKKL